MTKVTTVPSPPRPSGKKVARHPVLHELYPSKEAFEAEQGMEDVMGETFEQLDELLVTLSASAGRS